MRDHLDTTAAAQAQTAADTETATGAIAGEAEAVQTLNDALDTLLSKWFDSEAAMIAQNDAIAAVDQHMADLAEEFGTNAATSLDINTEAGRRNREMLADLFTATGDTITAMQDSGATSEELRAQWALDRAELSSVIERFRAAGVDVSAYDALLAEIDRMVATQVDVQDNASGPISAIQQRINALPDHKRILIDEILTRTTFGLYKPKVAGRWGMVTEFAKGGIDAHVGRGDLIRYAEPETGGEAYIPRLGNPERSKAILAEAAGWYGMTVVPDGIGQAMARAGGYVGIGPAMTAPGWGGGGAGGNVLVTLDLTGADDHLIERIKHSVRVEGRGDVQVALGTR
jgi:hypothetical protein